MDDDNNSLELKKQINMTFGAGYKKSDLADQVIHEEIKESIDVLEKLEGKHDIIPLIMDYRKYSKIKSTYIDPLLELINDQTGRIHTNFNQMVTATGRLSSTEPNLQNIPIRTEEGREIRKAFIHRSFTLFYYVAYSKCIVPVKRS